MPSYGTALLPAGLYAGDIPNLSIEAQALAGFFSELRNPRTKDLYTHSLKVYLEWCIGQHVNVMEARPVHLRLYITWLQQQCLWAESTISRMFGVVSVFYKQAVIDELILRDPTLGVKRPKVDKTKQRRTWLAPLEMARFLATTETFGPHPYAMVTLLGECGLRAAEGCSLRIEYMTRISGQDAIRFVGKGNKAAIMPLPPSVARAVQDAIGGRTEGPVVLNTEGNAYTPNSLWRLIKRIAEAADIDPGKVSPHTLRRTVARTANQLGVPLHRTQALLRHEDPKTTLLYIGQDNGMDNIASLQVAGFYAALAS